MARPLKKFIMFLLIEFLWILFFHCPSSLLAEEKVLSFEECEKLGEKIVFSQENLRKFVKEKNYEINSGNLTFEERNFFFENLRILVSDKEDFQKRCYKHYGVKLEDLEKLPQDRVTIFFAKTFYNIGLFSDVRPPRFDNKFFDFRYLYGFDMKYLIFPTKNSESFYKMYIKFNKKYLSGYEVKEVFCMMETSFQEERPISSDSKVRLIKSILKISCPKFHVEKEFPIQRVSVKVDIPDEEVKVESEEKTSIFTFLFTGKYRYTVTRKTINLGDNVEVPVNGIPYLLSSLFSIPFEAAEWLKRELSIRNLR
ncbi:MAG: hypothetical protein ABWJ99_04465 [Caldimicrobium sp.]